VRFRADAIQRRRLDFDHPLVTLAVLVADRLQTIVILRSCQARQRAPQFGLILKLRGTAPNSRALSTALATLPQTMLPYSFACASVSPLPLA
jgi:hypothetical protein